MSYSRHASWVIFSLIIMGCNSCDRHHGEGRTSFKALALAYEEAHAQKDVDALLALVYVGTGPVAEVNRRRFRARFERDLTRNIERVRRTRIKRRDRDAFEFCALKARGLMTVDWVPWEEGIISSSNSYPYGKHDGVYCLVGTGPEAVEEELREWSQGDHRTIKLPGVKQRADLALSRWQDETLDSQPILFWSALTRPSGCPITLVLDFYDEDMDVIGFGVEERYINPTGTDEVRREKYPVYVHGLLWGNVINTVSVPVSIRDSNQRASVGEWDRYIRGSDIDVNIPMSREDWESTLPPVWVSRPDPNVVEVKVYLYDRTGQESEPVQLLLDPRAPD